MAIEDNLGDRGAYTILAPGDVVLSTDSVTAPMWSNNDPNLTIFYTSSTQISSNVQEYYTTIYQTASTEATAEIQFDVAYGDQVGSGSQFLNSLVTGSTPTRTNYGQYRNLVLGDENANFIFAGITSSYWYAMPIERARYKQTILPGTWTLRLGGYSSTVLAGTPITTNLTIATGLPGIATQVVLPSETVVNIPNNGLNITFLNPDGTVVAPSPGNPNPPTINGTVDISTNAQSQVSSLNFDTTNPTNLKAGMIMKFLGSLFTAGGGADGVNDVYLRINENWMLESATYADDTIQLTDDSKLSSVVNFCDAGRIFNIISGSAGVKTPSTFMNINGYTAASGSYGFMLPDINTLILNGEALDAIPQRGGINFGTSRSFDSKGENSLKLVNSLNRGLTSPPGAQGTGQFTINSKEDLSSDYLFCRARNSEFNYSANPSFISSSTGAVLFPEFINNPTTYITTVGLYNTAGELLAVAKLSRPLEKNFTKELLVRVKLDF
jgi:hypothetical protein